jgi:hypothetical protein
MNFNIFRVVNACSGNQISFMLVKVFKGTLLEAVAWADKNYPHGNKVEACSQK